MAKAVDMASATDEERRAAFDDAEDMPPPDSAASEESDPLANAPTFASLYGVAELVRDAERELVSLATLPPWPGASHMAGHGWGQELDDLLGGGVGPGCMLALGASHAGAGKTGFTMQVADGLALRTAKLLRTGEDGPLTPVLVLSEMSVAALSWRTLARWTGHDSRWFRAGRSAERLAHTEHDREFLRAGRHIIDAREALTGALGDSQNFMRMFSPRASGRPLVSQLAAAVNAWRAALEAEHRREVWPVVVIDPIQRWQATEKGEVEALNELVESIGEAANAGGWIVLCTSDTNKATATGQNKSDGSSGTGREEGTAAFRGSYKLLHMVDAALVLRRPDTEKDTVEALVVKNRWGTSRLSPRFEWETATGRFTPCEASLTRGVRPSGPTRARDERPAPERRPSEHDPFADLGEDSP